MSAGPHLDDDALSAHLDGYDVGAGDHLAACAECRARLDALAGAAALIGMPPAPPPSHVLSAAVAHAVDAEERRSRRPVLVALAAAAVVVLGVVGVATVGDDDGSSDSDVALRPTADEVMAGGEAVTDESGGSLFHGDLGEVGDAAVLADRVRAAVEPSGAATDSGATMSQSSPLAATSGRSAGATTTTIAKDPWCEKAVAKELDEGLNGLVYRATLTWQGTPAVAVAYALDEPKGELDHRLYVLATGSCRLLVAQTF